MCVCVWLVCDVVKIMRNTQHSTSCAQHTAYISNVRRTTKVFSYTTQQQHHTHVKLHISEVSVVVCVMCVVLVMWAFCGCGVMYSRCSDMRTSTLQPANENRSTHTHIVHCSCPSVWFVCVGQRLISLDSHDAHATHDDDVNSGRTCGYATSTPPHHPATGGSHVWGATAAASVTIWIAIKTPNAIRRAARCRRATSALHTQHSATLCTLYPPFGEACTRQINGLTTNHTIR